MLVACMGDEPLVAWAPCGLKSSATVTENDILRLQLACADGRELPHAIKWSNLPEGAHFDAARAELSWTPSLDQAGDYTLEAILEEREHALLRVHVLDRFDDPDNVPVRDARSYREELGVPVIHVQLAGMLNADAYVPAVITYAGREYAQGAAKYRGATSLAYPKRSYTLKFDEADRFRSDEPNFAAPRRRIVLTTTFDDNSNLRQRLAYTLWNASDGGHIPIASYNVVLYVDGMYQGMYLLSDHIDDDLLEAHGVSQAANLYKAREHSANFRALDQRDARKPSWHDGYTKEEGKPEVGQPGAYADLDALVQWIASASPEAFAGEFASVLRREDFEDWFILVSLIAANDSAGKNSYLVHEPDVEGSLWRVLPWDFNASFGQTYRTARRAPEVYTPDYYIRSNRIFELLCTVPQLREVLKQRYNDTLNQRWHVDTVLGWWDAWAEEIREASKRDELKWSTAYRSYDWGERSDFVSHEEEVAYVRHWIRSRWELHASWR